MRRFLGWLLRIFFRLLYHQFAWTYDWVAAGVSLGMWNEWVRSVLPYLKAGSVIELGHGPGHLQIEMFRKGLQPFGLDASPQMSLQATRKLCKEGYQPRLVNSIAQRLPFNDETFQTVVATFPSEYIVDPQTLSEIKRVLKPNGEAVILALAWITGRHWLEKATRWLFKTTGQSPEWEDRFLEPVREAGLQVGVEWVNLKSSRLAIIVARKV